MEGWDAIESRIEEWTPADAGVTNTKRPKCVAA